MVNNPAAVGGGLTALDRQLLEHVHRFRMTTQEIVHHLFFATATLEAAKSRLRRLREAGWLISADLALDAGLRTPGKRRYYHLTPKAVQQLFGEPAKVAKPLGEQAIAEAYGTLLFCCLPEPPREKFTRADFEAFYPDLVTPGLPGRQYYRDVDNSTERIGLILVDQGADYRRIVRKCRKVIASRFRLPAWRERMAQDGFLIAIVTASDTKADRLHAAIKARRELCVAKFRIEVYGDLLALL